MQVVLTKDVKNLGQKWDICEVKAGYFRNFLLPEGLAVMPTSSLYAEAQKHIEARARKMAELKAEAEKIKTELDGVVLHFARKTNKSGEGLYAALHEKEIAAELKKEAKLEVTPDKIKLKEQIKKVGKHKVEVELAEGVYAAITVEVEAA